MKLLRHSRLFSAAVVPVLTFGLFIAVESTMDKDDTLNLLPPNTSVPGEQRSGSPSIVPGDGDMTKIEYRNIVFTDRDGSKLGPADSSGVASPELL